jgi:hypothetical protein
MHYQLEKGGFENISSMNTQFSDLGMERKGICILLSAIVEIQTEVILDPKNTTLPTQPWCPI